MTIRPRGASFMVDVKVAAAHNPTRSDVRVRVTAKDRDEAIRLETLVRAEVMRTGRWSPDAEPGKLAPASKRAQGTLKAALDLAWDHPTRGWSRMNAGKMQHRNAAQCIEILGGDTLCAEVREADFYRVAKVLEEEHYNSNDTITRKLQALYRVLWFAQKAGWIKARPEWERPTPGMAREFTFTPELEAETIGFFEAVALNPDMADLFRLGVDTGCRLTELLSLEASDVDLRGRFLTVRGQEDVRGDRRTKNGEHRTVILVDRALEVLRRRIMAVGRQGSLFPGFNSTRVSRLMRQAREAVGAAHNEEFVFHATRHTCASRMADRGVELVHMMQQLGHKTPSMTMRYVKMSPAARRAAILKSVGQSHLEAVAAN